MSHVSHPIHRSKKLSNHARCCVFLRQSVVQVTHGWWMEMCSGCVQHEQLDVQFPPMSSTSLNPVKDILEAFQWWSGRERALHERILRPKFSSHKPWADCHVATVAFVDIIPLDQHAFLAFLLRSPLGRSSTSVTCSATGCFLARCSDLVSKGVFSLSDHRKPVQCLPRRSAHQRVQ